MNSESYAYKDFIKLLYNIYLYNCAETADNKNTIELDYNQICKKIEYPYFSEVYLKNYFIEFINKVPSFGKSFICVDDKINNEIIKKIKNKNFYTYGEKNNSNFKIKNIKQHETFSVFDVDVSLPNKKAPSFHKFDVIVDS